MFTPASGMKTTTSFQVLCSPRRQECDLQVWMDDGVLASVPGGPPPQISSFERQACMKGEDTVVLPRLCGGDEP